MLEYPKHIHKPGGNPMKDFVVVHSREDEITALTKIEADLKAAGEAKLQAEGHALQADVPVVEVTATEATQANVVALDELTTLRAEAAAKGVKVDKRWGIGRLRELLHGDAA